MSNIVREETSSVIELEEEGVEGCEDMEFIYVCVCICEKICTRLQLQVKLVYGYKSIFSFSARREMIDFFVSIHNAFAQYICN